MRYQINKLIGRDLTKEDELKEHIDGLTKEQIYDLCVVFEAAALSQLEKKIEMALALYPDIKGVWLGGGVVASARLRQVLRKSTEKNRITLRYPYAKKLTGDNAAMIGVAANIRVQKLGGTTEIKNQLSSNDISLEEKGIFVKNFDNIDRNPNLSL
jgi:tRNA A37 threonylcarbamoyltransferase TsaD